MSGQFTFSIIGQFGMQDGEPQRIIPISRLIHNPNQQINKSCSDPLHPLSLEYNKTLLRSAYAKNTISNLAFDLAKQTIVEIFCGLSKSPTHTDETYLQQTISSTSHPTPAFHINEDNKFSFRESHLENFNEAFDTPLSLLTQPQKLFVDTSVGITATHRNSSTNRVPQLESSVNVSISNDSTLLHNESNAQPQKNTRNQNGAPNVPKLINQMHVDRNVADSSSNVSKSSNSIKNSKNARLSSSQKVKSVVPTPPLNKPTGNREEKNFIRPETKKKKERPKHRENFSDQVVDYLTSWLIDNQQSPYPNKEQKLELSSRTGLSLHQLDNCLGLQISTPVVRSPDPISTFENFPNHINDAVLRPFIVAGVDSHDIPPEDVKRNFIVDVEFSIASYVRYNGTTPAAGYFLFPRSVKVVGLCQPDDSISRKRSAPNEGNPLLFT
ncbi:hypothetical protein HK098_004000 [Nowakowskiella sp. JEL0407]|nr:hypothetical protein HK098_004000 [Nowakowskiella sp. JEL0407]